MQYLNTIFALTTSAALVAGNPTGPVKWTGGSKEGMTGHQAAQQCGSQQSVACCQNSSGGLLGGLLNGVLGGDCGLVNRMFFALNSLSPSNPALQS